MRKRDYGYLFTIVLLGVVTLFVYAHVAFATLDSQYPVCLESHTDTRMKMTKMYDGKEIVSYWVPVTVKVCDKWESR